MTRPWAIAFAGASLLVAGIVLPQIAGQAAGTGPKFVNFELAGTPPQPPGTSCPGHPNCFNGAAEPAIRAGADGTFYGSSENGLGSGTLAWKSVDGGRHYLSLLSPNGLSSSNNTGFV